MLFLKLKLPYYYYGFFKKEADNYSKYIKARCGLK